MRVKKIISLVSISVFIATLFVGCGKKDRSKTIRFLNFNPKMSEKYKMIAEKYKKLKDVEVIIETPEAGTYEKQLSLKLSTDDSPTIFQINGPIGYLNWKDYCKDLTKTKIYKHLADKSLAISNKKGVFGIPYDVKGYGIIYNQEIMSKYFKLDTKRTKYASVDEINNFKSLKEVVEDIQENKDKLEIEGCFAVTSLKSGEDWRWQTHLANLLVYHEFKKNNVDLTSDNIEGFSFAYSDNYKNIFDLYINNSTVDPKMLGTQLVYESMNEFALEKCVMVQNGNWAWSQIEKVSGNKVKSSEIKFMPIYTDIEGEEKQGLCIGTEDFFCINSKASKEKQKLAEKFLYWLFSSKKGKDYVTNSLGFVAPFDTFKEDEKPTDPLSKEVIRWVEREDVETVPWDFTLFPSQKFKDDFGTALLKYAKGEKSWPDVKKIVAKEWKTEWENIKK